MKMELKETREQNETSTQNIKLVEGYIKVEITNLLANQLIIFSLVQMRDNSNTEELMKQKDEVMEQLNTAKEKLSAAKNELKAKEELLRLNTELARKEVELSKAK